MKKFLEQVWHCARNRTDPVAVLDAQTKAVTQLAAIFAGKQWADLTARLQAPEDPLISLIQTHLRSVRCGHLLILEKNEKGGLYAFLTGVEAPSKRPVSGSSTCTNTDLVWAACELLVPLYCGTLAVKGVKATKADPEAAYAFFQIPGLCERPAWLPEALDIRHSH